jgi:cytochrome c biogenesis protein CcmG/thiol:disulfide interchange protein DsbE
LHAPTDGRPPFGRRLLLIPVAAAGAAVLGAALLWLLPRPPAPPVAVIGGSGSPVPPGRGGGAAGPALTVKPVPAPAFALTVLSPGAPPDGARGLPAIPAEGRPLALAALRGHPVVVNFWGSWCVPCREEMPLLVQAWHHYAARGIVVVGLDMSDTPADARRFLAEHHVDYPIVTVPDEGLPRAYGVIGLPTTVFIDGAGMIRARQLGGFVGPDGERLLKERLDALLAAHDRPRAAP